MLLGSVSDILIMQESDLRREVDENCSLRGYYAACSSSSVPKFRDNLSVPSSRVKNPSERAQVFVLIYVCNQSV